MSKKRSFKGQLVVSGGQCTVLLYGEIGEYDDVRSGDITRELLQAQAEYKRIDVRINSIGGSVYAGIAIFNALKNCTSEVNIYVDGLAASMASVIALCGRHVEMSKYARLMLHSVSGGCWGNKNDMAACIKEIEALEDTLCSMCAKRVGLTTEEVKAKYFDGRDHWLTAQEALDAGFIDGIYDAEPVPEDETIEQLYNTFNNRLVKPQKQTNMSLLDSVKKSPRFKDCATDEDVLRIVGQLEEKAGKVDALAAENTGLKTKIQAFEKKEQEAAEAAKKDLLDKAEKAGKIDTNTRTAYEALLDKDFEKGKSAIEALKPVRRAAEDILHPGDEEGSVWENRMKEIRAKRQQA
nr:MAG TPA: Putative ATP dependent Clp protease [Caudoviricetes sp.]